MHPAQNAPFPFVCGVNIGGGVRVRVRVRIRVRIKAGLLGVPLYSTLCILRRCVENKNPLRYYCILISEIKITVKIKIYGMITW